MAEIFSKNVFTFQDFQHNLPVFAMSGKQLFKLPAKILCFPPTVIQVVQVLLFHGHSSWHGSTGLASGLGEPLVVVVVVVPMTLAWHSCDCGPHLPKATRLPNARHCAGIGEARGGLLEAVTHDHAVVVVLGQRRPARSPGAVPSGHAQVGDARAWVVIVLRSHASVQPAWVAAWLQKGLVEHRAAA